MEQVLDDKYVGEGCKKTYAYICHLEPDDLEIHRKKFWTQKMNENGASWYIISEAWHSDEPQAKAILEAAGFVLMNNTLEQIVNPKGEMFKVPIYCINDPINYNAEFHLQQLKNKERPKETRVISVRIMNAKDGKKEIIDVENTEDAISLKQLFGVNHDWSDTSKIRMFYMGKELENDVCIDAYDINDEIYVWGLIIPDE